MVIVPMMLYTAALALANRSAQFPWLSAGIMAVYVAALLGWILRTGRRKKLGLSSPALSLRGWLMLLPLGLFPAYNLMSGQAMWNGAWAVQMLCVAVAEELFFRGFLFDRLHFLGALPGAVLSAAVFGLCHTVNLAGGSGEVSLQMLSAFGAGLCYWGVRLRCASLLPCIAAHFLTNITAPAALAPRIGLLVCSILSALWGVVVCSDHSKYKKEKNT